MVRSANRQLVNTRSARPAATQGLCRVCVNYEISSDLKLRIGDDGCEELDRTLPQE